MSDRHIYRTKEDLPHGLQVYYQSEEEDTGIMPFFHHPLYVSIMPMLLPEPIDAALERRYKIAYAYLDQEDFQGYVFAHERGYRIPKLIRLGEDMLDVTDPTHGPKFWSAAGSVWVDAEYDEGDPLWEELLGLRHKIDGFENIMEFSPRVKLRAAQTRGAHMKLYRGIQAPTPEAAHEKACRGFSWTGTERVAAMFAKRMLGKRDKAFMASVELPATAALAHITQRDEDEYLVPPENVGEALITITER